MDFDLSKPQKMLQDSARTFFQRECSAERLRELIDTESACDERLWSGIAEQGWLGLTLPESVGGLELGYVELAIVAEELGRACAPGPFLATTWAASLLAESANDAAKDRWLGKIIEGGTKGSVALLEAEPSWDPADVKFEAKPSGGGYRLNGTKQLVLDAGAADVLICVAQAGKELVLSAVEAGRAGVKITDRRTVDITRRYADVTFESVEVGEDDVLAVGKAAEQALSKSLQVGAVVACAELTGCMQWILEATTEYAKTRKQFDVPIGSFQAVQHQCADMLLFTESSRSATYYAAWALGENDPDARRAVSIAKAYCSDAGREVGNRGVQVHGGIGFTWEHDLQLYYRRAKANELLFGDPGYHREQIARAMVDTESTSLESRKQSAKKLEPIA